VAKSCGICIHPDRQKIEKEIINGTSLRDIAGQFSVSKSSLARHKEHLPPMALEAVGREKTEQLTNIVDSVIRDFENVRKRFCTIADKAADVEDLDAEIAAMKEVRMTMTDTLKAKGMWAPAIANAVQVNVGTASLTTAPEYPILMAVLSRHPEIHSELSTALKEGGF